jgi:hypothetical protein
MAKIGAENPGIPIPEGSNWYETLPQDRALYIWVEAERKLYRCDGGWPICTVEWKGGNVVQADGERLVRIPRPGESD